MLEKPMDYDPEKTGLSYLEYWQPHNVYHPGIDLNWGKNTSDDLRMNVVAPDSAIVTYVSKKGNNGGLGLYVVLYHPDLGVWTRYLHLDSVDFKARDILFRGQSFAKLGKSGTALPHLHFEVLNSKGIQHIENHWRQPYNGYFAGLSRAEVASMTLDPLPWIENTGLSSDMNAAPDWRFVGMDWARENGIVIGGWDNPALPMSQERVVAAMKKMWDALKK